MSENMKPLKFPLKVRIEIEVEESDFEVAMEESDSTDEADLVAYAALVKIENLGSEVFNTFLYGDELTKKVIMEQALTTIADFARRRD